MDATAGWVRAQQMQRIKTKEKEALPSEASHTASCSARLLQEDFRLLWRLEKMQTQEEQLISIKI